MEVEEVDNPAGNKQNPAGNDVAQTAVPATPGPAPPWAIMSHFFSDKRPRAKPSGETPIRDAEAPYNSSVRVL